MIPMQQSFDEIRELLSKVDFLTGDADAVLMLDEAVPDSPFDEKRIGFLDLVSKNIMKDTRSRAFPDVVTFAFWIRKANINIAKKKHEEKEAASDDVISRGRGIAFHIAPSNVAVNFAYSLVTGFITGNYNIVRVPSKAFEQVDIIAAAFCKATEEYKEFKPAVILVRYGRDKEINDYFSSVCDTRIVWGGDNTIAQLRESPVPSRTNEITFADRYSFAIIDAEYYLDNCRESDKYAARTAKDFYNDTYLTDQQACTAPRLICWIGSDDLVKQAADVFWKELAVAVENTYEFQEIQGVDKLTNLLLAATEIEELSFSKHEDGRMYRAGLEKLNKKIMDYRGNSGFFYEYNLKDESELNVMSDKRIQTVSYIGEKEKIKAVVDKFRTKGIDRIVPTGHSMDFDFIWDGYDLITELTRKISVL